MGKEGVVFLFNSWHPKTAPFIPGPQGQRTRAPRALHLGVQSFLGVSAPPPNPLSSLVKPQTPSFPPAALAASQPMEQAEHTHP